MNEKTKDLVVGSVLGAMFLLLIVMAAIRAYQHFNLPH